MSKLCFIVIPAKFFFSPFDLKGNGRESSDFSDKSLPLTVSTVTNFFLTSTKALFRENTAKVYCLSLHKAGTINAKQYSHSETMIECEIFGSEEFSKEARRYKAKK